MCEDPLNFNTICVANIFKLFFIENKMFLKIDNFFLILSV